MLTRRGLLVFFGSLVPAAAQADSLVFENGRYYRIPDPDAYPDDTDWVRRAPLRPLPRRDDPAAAPDDLAPQRPPSDAVDDDSDIVETEDERQARLSTSPIPKKVVRFGGYAPGTLVVSTREKRLYLVLDDGETALRYGVGVGRDGFSWKGNETVSAKRRWPDWTPPAEMIARDPKLPTHMDGGLGNPLGARALYLGETLYRIHGTNQPSSIGHAVSSGCVRLANADIIDLYPRVPVGTPVTVI